MIQSGREAEMIFSEDEAVHSFKIPNNDSGKDGEDICLSFTERALKRQRVHQ